MGVVRVAVAVALAFVVFAIATVLAPEATARWTAKEGVVEHVSHAVLGVALLAWVRRAWALRRSRSRESDGTAWFDVAVVVWCGAVLGEELDWGAVYGCHALADPLIAWTGRPDLHNAWSGSSYLVFAIPVVGLGVLGLRGRFGLDRCDAAALLVVVVASAVGTLGWPAHEHRLDEVCELVLYAVLVWIGVRVRPSDGRTAP